MDEVLNLKKKALFVLGNTYEDLDEETKNKVDEVYEPSIIKGLTKHKWSFATETAELQTQPIENHKYNYVATLPQDYLCLINVYNDIKETNLIEDYITKNNKIYSNNKTMAVKYIQRVAEKDMPNHFKEYIKYEIASELCYNLTGDTELLQIIELKRQEKYNIACNIEDKQKQPFRFLKYPFNNIRN